MGSLTHATPTLHAKQTYDEWREGRDEDEDDENEEYDDGEEQTYVLFKLEVSAPGSHL